MTDNKLTFIAWEKEHGFRPDEVTCATCRYLGDKGCVSGMDQRTRSLLEMFGAPSIDIFGASMSAVMLEGWPDCTENSEPIWCFFWIEKED